MIRSDRQRREYHHPFINNGLQKKYAICSLNKCICNVESTSYVVLA
jgi:hypothetical protein